MEVREHLRQHGVERSFHGTQALLRSRIPLGEIRFGAIVNEHAHEAIVDADTWRRVQRQIVSRGRRPKSERLRREANAEAVHAQDPCTTLDHLYSGCRA
jgi:hypothetical protein